ncbi:avidin/streptavidin family protein [Streptomyces sp. NPDC050549]|uniref:avidin/streptavidin family protein n=1 Tax=Streptomyces sp. NPDC050549 TaxID=3155406 RepID=UPI00343DD007
MSISGDWYNEFGSHLRITADPNGSIRGTYISATGHAVGTYPLVGRYDTAAVPGHGTPLGWAVAWRNGRTDAGSVTSWSGQYYEDGGEKIYVTWLLTASAIATSAWEATSVGQDVFTRELPSPEGAEQLLRHAEAPTDPYPVDELTPV